MPHHASAASKRHRESRRKTEATAVTRPRWRYRPFLFLWVLTTAGLGWQLAQGKHSFEQDSTIPALLAVFVCTVALLRWLPGASVTEQPGTAGNRRAWFILLAIGAATVLFAAAEIVGRALLFGLPVVAMAVILWLRSHLSMREVIYAAALAIVAAIAGLGAGWITYMPPVGWAALQLPLVVAGLLAGWAILSHTGLLKSGVGRSLFLTTGSASALRGFALGLVIGIPWALLNVLVGGANGDSWVHSWWQPLVAIQPGIAEEAWARVFLVSLVFLALAKVGKPRISMIVAVVIVGYWFAYLHTHDGINGLPSTILIGTLYSLPLSYLWLRKGLEAAIGFHFLQDFVRFAAALLLNQGLWPV